MERIALVSGLESLSLSIIKRSQYETGSFPASLANSHYRTCWLRDGFWIAEGLLAAGEVERVLKFYEWVDMVFRRYYFKLLRMPKRDEEVFHPRFTPEGYEINEPWGWHQLDAISSILFGLSKLHLLGYRQDKPLIKALSRYIERCWVFLPEDHSVWEEEKAIHLASIAPAIASLKLASKIVSVNQLVVESMEDFVWNERFKAGKFIDHESKIADFSVMNVWSFGLSDSLSFLRTARFLESELGGKYGLKRYHGDRYFSFNGKEGQWPLGRLWLAWYWHSLWKQTGKERFGRKFRRNLFLATSAITEEGFIPEQVMPKGAESIYDAIKLRNGRYGNAIATPLLWAHAMLLIARSNHSILQIQQ